MDQRDMTWAAAAAGAEILAGSGVARFCGISTDSRTAGPGQLFVALRGDRFDGHDHVPEALGRGVAGIVVSRFERGLTPGLATVLLVQDPRVALGRLAGSYRREFEVPVVCVAGSNGKTTTKDATAAVLSVLGPVLKSQASFNNDVGVPLTLLGLESRHRAAVVEAGTNHPGELAPLLGLIRPGIGILTGIGREHLEHFGDLAGVAREEGALAEALPPGGLLVMNGDTPFSDSIAARCRAEVVRFGWNAGNDWRLLDCRLDWSGTEFELAAPVPGWSGRWRVGIPGRHMAQNATAALVVAARLGVDPVAARGVLETFRASKARLEVMEAGGVRILNDCYNANADSMLAALQTLSDLPCAGRRVAVLGDMAELGPASEPAHGEVGRRAATAANLLFAVGGNAPLTAGAARVAGLARVSAHGDVAAMLPGLLETVRAGDVVLVKASRSARLERVTEALLQHLGNRGKG